MRRSSMVSSGAPTEVFLQRPDETLGDAVPSGSRTKDGEASMPRKAISLWKSLDM